MDYKKVLRLHFMSHLSGREIAGICDCGKTTVMSFSGDLRTIRSEATLSLPT